MEIRVHQYGDRWDFSIVTSNGTEIACAQRMYANRRNAVAAANKIAKSKLKVVVEG